MSGFPYVKESFPFIESGGPQKRLEHLNHLFKIWGVCVCVCVCMCMRARTWQATFLFAVWFPVKLGPKRRKAELEVEKGTCCFWFRFLFLPASWQRWFFILATAVCLLGSQNSLLPTQRYWYQLTAALQRPSLRLLSPNCVGLSSKAPRIPTPADQF